MPHNLQASTKLGQACHCQWPLTVHMATNANADSLEGYIPTSSVQGIEENICIYINFSPNSPYVLLNRYRGLHVSTI